MVGGGGMAWRGDGERAAEGGPGPGAAAVWFRLVIIWPHALAAVSNISNLILALILALIRSHFALNFL